jgi:hypothetical protein
VFSMSPRLVGLLLLLAAALVLMALIHVMVYP